MKRMFYPLIFLLLGAFGLQAQIPDPCTNRQAVLRLMHGARYTAKCDSIYILSSFKYLQMRNKIAFNDSLIKEYKSMTGKLDETNDVRSKFNSQLKQYIAKQDSAIDRYKEFTTKADSLVTRSTANTDSALTELRKARFKMFIYSTVAALSGVTVGFLMGKATD
ncbi:MAG: hypothetical protein GXO75_20085 [Calditrichaeota bacterium]|nr:hypothetical protein [Calditrichota bacterium]